MSDVKMIQRVATEFATPEALKAYLREHPGADPKKHRVTKREDGSSGSGGGATVTVKDKGVAKDLADLGMPHGSAVDSVGRMIADGRPVSFNMINKAVVVLHDQANKPGLDKNKAKKMRDLRTKLKGLGGSD